MNSQELLSQSQITVQAIYDAALKHLSALASAAGSKIEALPPVVGPVAEGSVASLAAIRLPSSKASSIFVIGTTSPEDAVKFTSLFTPPAPQDPKASKKTAEYELMKALFPAFETAMKAHGLIINQSAAMILSGPALGDWSKVTTAQSAKFGFKTSMGDIFLHCPIFDSSFSTIKTEVDYGFAEDTRILVVDDSPTSRKLSRTHLAMAGYFNCDEAQDGQAALSKLLGSRPPFELVVADWHMPVMSGIELLKKIRSIEDIAKLPVILATGEQNKDEVLTAIKEGVTGYLVKPLEPATFFKSLKRAGQAAAKLKTDKVA